MKKHFLFIAALTLAVTMSAKDELVLTEGELGFVNDKSKKAIVEIDLSNCKVVEFGTNDKIKEDFGTIEQYLEQESGDLTARVLDKTEEKVAASEPGAASFDKVQVRLDMLKNYNGNMFNWNNKKCIRIIASDQARNLAEQMPAKRKKQMEKFGYVYDDRSLANYKIVLHVDTLDPGSGGGAIAFGGGLVKNKVGGAEIIGTMEIIDIATGNVAAKADISHLKGEANMGTEGRFHYVIDEMLIKCSAIAKKKKK